VGWRVFCHVEAFCAAFLRRNSLHGLRGRVKAKFRRVEGWRGGKAGAWLEGGFETLPYVQATVARIAGDGHGTPCPYGSARIIAISVPQSGQFLPARWIMGPA